MTSAATGTPPGTARATADLRLSADQLARHAADSLLAAAGEDVRPDVAVVLGSGWKPAADLLGEVLLDVAATEIPGFRAAAVAGHEGRLRLVRTADGAVVLVLGARTHLYEAHGVDAVAHGVRTAATAGCRAVVLTNGCGSLVADWGPGTVVLLRDHLNLTGTTPLRGPEFVDMTDAYATDLRGAAREVDASLPEGVYAQFHGPQYETPAEVRMAGVMGADLVGMSTALETIAARAAGLQVLALSLVTNLAAGTTDAPLQHDEVLAAGAAAAERCGPLLAGVVGAVARATAA